MYVVGKTRHLNYISYLVAYLLSSSIGVLSIIVALMLVLFIEMPCSSLITLMLSLPASESKDIKTKKTVSNGSQGEFNTTSNKEL